jgi:hypothetical protein
MISFLSSPKPFSGDAKDHQINAIRSWLAVDPRIEVVLYGNALGTGEMCRELNIRYIAHIQTSPRGVPYFNAIVEHARTEAKHDVQIYMNCDIIVTPSICDAVHAIRFPKFVMIGQSIDMKEGLEVDPASRSFLTTLNELARSGKIALSPESGIDFFGFRRGMWNGLPPVVIGRGAYDNALLAYCLRRQIPLVDVTLSTPVFHPTHDYNHVAGGIEEIFSGIDAVQNARLSGINHSSPCVSDAQWEVRHGQLVESRVRGDVLRALELRWRFVNGWTVRGLAIRVIWRLLRAIGAIKNRNYNLATVLGMISSRNRMEPVKSSQD